MGQRPTDCLIPRKTSVTSLDCKGLNEEQVVNRSGEINGVGGAASDWRMLAKQAGKTILQITELWPVVWFITPAQPHEVLGGGRHDGKR